MELNCITISKILQPLQAAHYMLRAYPQHCDALALSNTLAKAVSLSTEGGGGAAGEASTGGCGVQNGACC